MREMKEQTYDVEDMEQDEIDEEEDIEVEVPRIDECQSDN